MVVWGFVGVLIKINCYSDANTPVYFDALSQVA